MPELKTRRLFISHAWSYSVHYHQVVNWFMKSQTLHGVTIVYQNMTAVAKKQVQV